MSFYSEVYSIEHKFELISGEDLNNEHRIKVKKRIESLINDLHIVVINIDSYKCIMSSEGENLRIFSPAFVSSFVYSTLSTNILLISNLFDKDKRVLSLYKLINLIEQDKKHLECRHYERRENKDLEWNLVDSGKLQAEINGWKNEIELLKEGIIDNINTLRDKLYAHKDLSFIDSNRDISLSFDEFEVFVEKVFEFLNKISSCIFYESFAFFNHHHPDIEQSLMMINNYRKYKTDVIKLIRNGTIPKK